MVADNTVLFREVQPYRELPPFILLTAVGAAFGWFLLVWTVALGRPLGALALPPWLGVVLGLFFGVLLPFFFLRLRMVTEVLSDRVTVANSFSGRVVFPLAEVASVTARTDDVRDDYNIRNIGRVRETRIAYTVTTNEGVQLELRDGRLFLIGSKQPAALAEAVAAAWRVAQPAAA